MNQASSDIETLKRLVALPYPPLAATWQIVEPAPNGTGLGPKDWSLVAVLTFANAHHAEILLQSAEVETPQQPLLSAAYLPDWLPGDLRQRLSAESVKAWQPTLFTQAPLLHGYLVPLEDHSRFFLFLHTM